MFKRPVLLTIFACFLLLGTAACGGSGNSSNNNADNSANATPSVSSTQTSSPTPSPTPTAAPLLVSGFAMAVNPSSLASISCGTSTSIVFSAAITVSQATGGTLPYTWNIGSTQSSGTLTFTAGQTSKVVTYTVPGVTVQYGAAITSATLTAGPAGKTSTSAAIKPVGNCSLPGPFKVVNITLSFTPSTVAGLPCNSNVTIVYSATITIGSDSNGGTVSLTWNVGTYHPTASVVFAPLQTVQTITYSEPGKLVTGNSNGFPRITSLTATSPNTFATSSTKPLGTCK